MCVESLPGRETEEIDFPLDGLARRLLIWRGWEWRKVVHLPEVFHCMVRPVGHAHSFRSVYRGLLCASRTRKKSPASTETCWRTSPTSSTRILCFCANRSNSAPCRLDFSPASSQITTAFCNPPRFSALRRKSSTVVARPNPFVSQQSCCRRRWSDGDYRVPLFAQSALHFPERGRFSGSGDTAKTEDSIRVARIAITASFCSSERCAARTKLDSYVGS